MTASLTLRMWRFLYRSAKLSEWFKPIIIIHLAITTYRPNDGLLGRSHRAYQQHTLLTYVVPENDRFLCSHFFSKEDTEMSSWRILVSCIKLQRFHSLLRDPFAYNIHNLLLSITNKMQRYTICFIAVNALHVSECFSAHHLELKNCTHSIWYRSSLLAATASVGELALPSQPR